MKTVLCACMAASVLIAGCHDTDETTLGRGSTEPPPSPPVVVVAVESDVCTGSVGSSRYSVCGKVSSASVPELVEGAGIIGTTDGHFGTVSSETHTLGGMIRAN
jgi:hypothetical protein